MTNVAWPNGAVRPYESLWMLCRCFAWLNLPNHKDLVGKDTILSMRGVSLIWRGIARFARQGECLRKLLGLSCAEWTDATLDIEAFGEVGCDEIRFCPECLKFAYHTVGFQLSIVTDCPIHGCPLVSGCIHCGQSVGGTLTTALLRNPLSCQYCRRVWVEPVTVIQSPSLPWTKKLAELAEWIAWASGVQRVELRARQLEDPGRYANTVSLSLLERFGGRSAPSGIRLEINDSERRELVSSSLRPSEHRSPRKPWKLRLT
jgi:hypothetical protein